MAEECEPGDDSQQASGVMWRLQVGGSLTCGRRDHIAVNCLTKRLHQVGCLV